MGLSGVGAGAKAGAAGPPAAAAGRAAGRKAGAFGRVLASAARGAGGGRPGPLPAPLPGAARPSPGRGEPPPHHARAGRDRDADADRAQPRDDALDPLRRAHGQAVELAPLGGAIAAAAPSPAPSIAAGPLALAAASIESLLPALVRRIAWSGDGRRGTVRLELGAGELAGGVVVVHADGGREVRVELAPPPGVDASALRARIRARLAARGLSAVVE